MSAIERTDQDNGFVLQTRHGTARVGFPGSGCVTIDYTGIAAGGFADEITRELDGRIAWGERLELFVDASQLASYETAFRTRWASWMKDNRPHLEAVHILFRSKVVQMGISLVSPLVGGLIRSWSNASRFEALKAERARRTA